MIERYITKTIAHSLLEFPAVLLMGARQVGKSTLAESLLHQGLVESYVTLDNFSQLEAATNDPDGFIAELPMHVAIDEIQRSSPLLHSIKRAIDEQRRSRRFLLTGSANVLAQADVSESLGGRVDVIHLEGLMLAELNQKQNPPNLVDSLLTSSTCSELREKLLNTLNRSDPLDRKMLAQSVFWGGFPEVAIKAQVEFAQRWFAAYQATYIERDVHQVAKGIDAIRFNKALMLSSFNTGQLAVMSHLCNAMGIDHRTLQRYLGILQLTYQIIFLQPWHTNTRKRLTKTPKLYCLDSGMACFLNGITDPTLLLTHNMFGALAETWVFAELRKMIAAIPGVHLHFYRTQTGKEVDFIISRGQTCCGIELKLANTVNAKDFAGLQDWQGTHRHNTIGIILYTGDEWISFGKTLAAVPIKVLRSF